MIKQRNALGNTVRQWSAVLILGIPYVKRTPVHYCVILEPVVYRTPTWSRHGLIKLNIYFNVDLLRIHALNRILKEDPRRKMSWFMYCINITSMSVSIINNIISYITLNYVFVITYPFADPSSWICHNIRYSLIPLDCLPKMSNKDNLRVLLAVIALSRPDTGRNNNRDITLV